MKSERDLWWEAYRAALTGLLANENMNLRDGVEYAAQAANSAVEQLRERFPEAEPSAEPPADPAPEPEPKAESKGGDLVAHVAVLVEGWIVQVYRGNSCIRHLDGPKDIFFATKAEAEAAAVAAGYTLAELRPRGERTAEKERADTVAWLRSLVDTVSSTNGNFASCIADEIERGEHLKGGG